MSNSLLRDVAQDGQGEQLAYQRYALLGAISGILVHEFNNLMTPVLTRSQAALAYDDVRMMRKALECTVSQTQRAMEIGRRLLELAACRPVRLEALPVAAAVEAALMAAARPFEKDNIELTLRIDEQVRVRADRILFEQAVLSLLQAAREHLQRGGRITLSARADGDQVLIELTQSATRFSRQEIRDVLNPFLQSDVRRVPFDAHSLGFSLSAVRTIAHLHRASVEAQGDETNGTCTIRLRWPGVRPFDGHAP